MSGPYDSVKLLDKARRGEDTTVARIWFEALNELSRYRLDYDFMDYVERKDFDDREDADQYLRVCDVKALLERHMSPAAERLHELVNAYTRWRVDDLRAYAIKLGCYSKALTKKDALVRAVAEHMAREEGKP